MRLTYSEALAHWARYGGPKPCRKDFSGRWAA